MMIWLRRNTGPITAVLSAAAAIIVAFELIDLVINNGANDSPEEAVEATIPFIGLIKVTVFLAIPFALTLLVRRRTASTTPSRPTRPEPKHTTPRRPGEPSDNTR